MKLTSLCVAPNSSSNKLHLSSATRNRSLTWKQKALRLCTHLPLKVRPPRRHWCDATSPPLLDVNVKEASSSTALHFQFEKKLPQINYMTQLWITNQYTAYDTFQNIDVD